MTAYGVLRLAMHDSSEFEILTTILIPATFLALWLHMSLLASRLAIRGRRRGYATLAVLSMVTTPFGLVIVATFLSPPTLLGIGLATLGWRERCRPVWIASLLVTVLGLTLLSQPSHNALSPSNPASLNGSTSTVAACAGVVIIGLAAWLAVQERRKISLGGR